jgi:serine O-acetyltransferase
VEANVCIYANATILEAILSSVKQYGGNSWVTKTIPAGSLTNTTTTEVKIKELR